MLYFCCICYLLLYDGIELGNKNILILYLFLLATQGIN